jgi:PTH1 family peptidyl-tRNA hydrolase
MFYIVGLGNPGEEYAGNRHNAGRMATDIFLKKYEGKKAKVMTPDTFMNNTGKFVAKFIKSKKSAESLVVVYDDIDLALGTIKISYNKSSGGHNGLESIIKAVKTQEFTRIRIGVSPATPKGKVKKPKGEEAVLKFLLGNFKTAELETLKKVWKLTTEAIETIIEGGREIAMNRFN